MFDFKNLTINDEQGQLICPMKVIEIEAGKKDSSLILQIHPSACRQFEEACQDKQIGREVLEQIQLGCFEIFSKHIGLHHVYNVLRPLAEQGSTAQKLLDSIKDVNFDYSVMTTGQRVVLELNDPETDSFKMDSRAFWEVLSAEKSDANQSNLVVYKF